MLATRHLIIEGRVQGVWYRESMRIEAERLGVTGWVRNLPDGAVEAMLQGTPDAVDALIRWAWDGPPAARVEAIRIDPGSGTYASFERRPSARSGE
jgi:acylphosphatase